MTSKTVRTLGCYLISLGLGSAALAAPERNCPIEPPATAARYDIAVSLRRVQEELQTCQRNRNCSREVLELYGLTRVEGYAVDHANSDIVLFGGTRSDLPALQVDDLVVALRNVTKQYAIRRGNTLYYSDPGVSIDPDPNVMGELNRVMNRAGANSSIAARDHAIDQWCETCQLPQNVRVLGIPFDTHMARVMVTADYLMKRVADGSAGLDLDGFESLSDATMQHAVYQALNETGEGTAIGGMTRFWFYPGENTYVIEKDGVVLKRSDVILLDEAEHLTRSGEITSAGYVNPLARDFSCAFSQRYDEIADHKPIYRELENVFRWISLVRIMVDNNAIERAGLDLQFLQEEFKVQKVPVERQLSGIATVKKFDHVEESGHVRRTVSLRLPSCGGVWVHLNKDNMSFVGDITGRFREIMRAATTSRPDLSAVFWVLRHG